MSRRFTYREAESLIPQVDKLLRSALALKSEYDVDDGAIREMKERAVLMGGMVMDRRKIAEAKARRDAALERLRALIEEVQEIGCLIKDLDIGLIDFPTTFRGTEVYLCWKLGETGIHYWHGVDEGFRGRKEIDQDFLDHHTGDAPQ